jgi:hypothetical protein
LPSSYFVLFIHVKNHHYFPNSDCSLHDHHLPLSSSAGSTLYSSPPSTDNVNSLYLPIVSNSISSADFVEYASLAWLDTCDMLKASVDWNERSKTVDVAGITVAPTIPLEDLCPLQLDESPFLLDSGCTTHISPIQSDFSSLKAIDNRIVKGVSSSSIQAIGIGSIRLTIRNGRQICLKNILFIPVSTVRLLSVGQLTDSLDCIISFASCSIKINHISGLLRVSSSHLPTRSLYQLNCFHVWVKRAFLRQHVPSIDTWHRRLGHPNNQAIYDMATKGLTLGMPIDLSISLSKCEHCILGKQVQTPVPHVHSGERSTRCLGVVYVDLTGPEAVVSVSGNQYLMNIVDDFSSFPWSSPLKLKSDALPTLQAWARCIELEANCQIGTIHIDGGELDSGAMRSWCNGHGYTLQFSTPYTSVHNE